MVKVKLSSTLPEKSVGLRGRISQTFFLSDATNVLILETGHIVCKCNLEELIKVNVLLRFFLSFVEMQ